MNAYTVGGEHAANLEAAAPSAPCLDRPARLSDDVLDDREAEASPTRGAGPVRPEEAARTGAAARPPRHPPRRRALRGRRVVEHPLDRERNVAPGPVSGSRSPRGCARRPEHPRAHGELDVLSALEPELDACAGRALLQLVERLLQDGPDRGRSERDDPGSGLELAQEEHLVDELGDLLDLAGRPGHELGDVLARKGGGLEEGKQPGERRPELMRDRCREARAELLVRRRGRPRARGRRAARGARPPRRGRRRGSRRGRPRAALGTRSPSRTPSRAWRARRLASSTRSPASRTTTASRLSSTIARPRAASASMRPF